VTFHLFCFVTNFEYYVFGLKLGLHNMCFYEITLHLYKIKNARTWEIGNKNIPVPNCIRMKANRRHEP